MHTPLCLLCLMAPTLTLAAVPTVRLQNAASAGVLMPATGAGSGGYSGNMSISYGQYPECFDACADPQCALPNPPNFSGCGQFVDASISTWLQLGGRRVDGSDSYHNQLYVARAVHASGVPREDVFYTSKVGNYLPMGFADTHAQFATTLAVTGLSYVDLLLVHWPTCVTPGCEATAEPACNYKAPATYDEVACRLQTWRAMVEIWKAGGVRAIGVSNYNASHIQEIADAGLPLPAVNQVPFNLWHSRDAAPGGLLDFCRARSIAYNGYSPFAVADRHVYPGFPPSLVQDEALVAVAAAHARSPAEVALAWQWQLGVLVNPRSQNAAHMLENLNYGACAYPGGAPRRPKQRASRKHAHTRSSLSPARALLSRQHAACSRHCPDRGRDADAGVAPSVLRGALTR